MWRLQRNNDAQSVLHKPTASTTGEIKLQLHNFLFFLYMCKYYFYY